VGTIAKFDPHRVKPLPYQPRKHYFGELRELAESIDEIGQTTAGLVTLIEGDADYDAQLVDGERRLRACRMIDAKFRAEVVEPDSDDNIFAKSFAANFGRQSHDAVEIAEALDRLRKAGRTVPQLARIAGKSQPWVYQHLRVIELHPEVRALMVPNPRRANSGMRLASMVENFAVQLLKYVEMPGKRIEQLIEQTPPGTRKVLVDEMDSLAEMLTGLSGAFRARTKQKVA
jgi:ParB/RepB/Spo0J family partition protein